MDNVLRYTPGYRALFARWIPQFMINEIGPAISLLPESSFIDENLTVFDIGSNAGIWSAALLTHSGKYVRDIHMFEPMPGNRKRFEAHKHRGLYGSMKNKLKMNALAVSDINGALTINYDADETVYASASVRETLMGIRSVPLDKLIEVKSTTIDKYCDDQNIQHIHLLKADVEGYEMPVFEGAAKMLKKKAIDVLVYEFGTHQMARREYFKDFFEFFRDHGYSNYKTRPNGWPPVAIEKYNTNEEDFSRVKGGDCQG